DQAQQKAGSISEYLSNDKNFLLHSRRIGIDDLVKLQVRIEDMRVDPSFREAVHQLHIATMLTFQSTGAVKIVENCRGKALIMAIQTALAPPQPASPAIDPP